MTDDRACITCKFADFQKSKNSRRLRHKVGTCNYIVQWPALPLSVTRQFGYLEHSKGHIWAELTGCPVWEKKL